MPAPLVWETGSHLGLRHAHRFPQGTDQGGRAVLGSQRVPTVQGAGPSRRMSRGQAHAGAAVGVAAERALAFTLNPSGSQAVRAGGPGLRT